MRGSQDKRVAGAAAIVMSSIVLSRITGFLRELMIPNILGTGSIADAYNIAFKITGLMYELLVGGAIAAALIPVLTGYISRNEEEDGWKVVGTFINTTLVIMIFVCTLGVVFAPQIVPLIAVGFKNDSEVIQLTIELTRILFPSVAFLMLAGLTNGILNSYHRFAAAACGPSIYNFGSALSILLLNRFGVKYVAYGVMCSSCVYFLFQLSFALKNLKHYRFRFYLKHPGFMKLLKLVIPSLMASSIVQVNMIITNSFTTFFSEGSVTALSMADRTWQLPLGIIAQGMGIALLPTLSARLAVGQVNEYKSILSKGLKSALLLTIPACAGLAVLGKPIIRAIFKWTDKCTESSIVLAGSLLMFFAVALISQSIVSIVNRAFYATNDTKTPLFIGISVIATNTSLSYVFYKWTSLGVSGMALAYAIASILNASVLLFILNIKMKGIYLDKLLKFIVKTLLAAAVMGILIYFMDKLFIWTDSKLIQLIYLSLEVLAGAAIYFAIVLYMKIEEAQDIFKLIQAKLTSFTKRIVKKCP